MQGLLSRANISPMWGTYDPLLSSGLHSPRQLASLAAWYDVNDLSSMVYDGSNRVSLLADKSGNSNVNVLALNGVAGNYASAPDSVPLSITGDIDIRVRCALDDWTPAAEAYLVAKWGASGNMSWRFAISTSGNLRLYISIDGIASVNAVSSIVNTFTDFSTHWVRVTRVASSGATNFYTSSDGVTWSALGTTQTLSAGNNIFDGTNPLTIGLSLVGEASCFGTIYRAQIYNGINGTLVFDANFATAPKLASTFTESSSNAATVTINTSGATGARICGARDLYQGTVANQPVLNVWSGTNYGYLNGVVGNNFNSPDSAAVSITGDIDLRIYLAPASWASPVCHLLGKWNSTGNQLSYILALDGANHLQFANSNTGAAVSTNVLSAALPFSANQPGWVRATFASATGKVNFYTSTDSPSSSNPTWTQLGTEVAGTAATMFDGTAVVSVGYSPSATTPLNGKIYRAQIYNGIAGTLAFDFNPAAYVSGATFLDSSSNAATITINGGATIVQRTGLYFDGVNDYMKAASWSMAQPETVYFVGKQVRWIDNTDIYDGGVVNSMVLNQTHLAASPSLSLYSGSFGTANTSLALQTSGVVTSVFNNLSPALRINRGTATTGTIGSATSNGLTLASNATGIGNCNITASEILIYNAAHDTVTQDRTLLMLGRKWHIAV